MAAYRLRELWYRLSTRLRRASLERQLEEEMRFHHEMLARDFEQEGLTRADAESAAWRRFGGALSVRERTGDWWGFPWFDDLLRDIRYGVRMLRRSPGFALVSIGAIGLAIGINCGFFTLVDTMIWQPRPVRDPERLVKLYAVSSQGWTNAHFSYGDLDLLSSATTLEDIVGYDSAAIALRVPSRGAIARAASAGCVSADYFRAVGGSPSIGRFLGRADAGEGAPAVVVISDGMWQREFSRSPDAVGQDVVVNGVPATIVGVAAADFIGLNPLVPDLWMPFTLAARIGATDGDLQRRDNRFIFIHGRLARGVTMARAQAELSGLIAEAPSTRAEAARIVGIKLLPGESMVALDPTSAMVAAPGLVVVGLVLVIACANLANLLLSRALARQREIALRLAIGASRRRILRQLMTESLLIALVGAAVGFCLSDWTVTVASRSFLASIPTTFGTAAMTWHSSWRVLAYTAGLAMLSVLTFGLAPALQATAPNLTSALKGEDALFGTRLRRSRFREGLVVVQVAACLVLLVAAGTLVQSLRTFADADRGLAPRHVVAARIGLSGAGHVPPALAASRARFAARVAALPGVALTARAAVPPFTSWPLVHVATADRDSSPRRRADLPHNRVTPDYFDVVGQRLVGGRRFSDDDGPAGQVAIVTSATARALWPKAPAIGQSLQVAWGGDAPDTLVRIVGVVADAHSGMVWDWDGDGYIFFPASPADLATQEMPVLVRADPEAPDLSRALEDVARDVDPNAPPRMARLTELFALQLLPFKYAAAVAAGVGVLGLVLAIIGLYGIVAFAVAGRRIELAVHVAMGATPRDVLELVLRREMRLVVFGLAIGLIVAVGEARLLGSLVVPLAPLGAGGVVAIAAALSVVAVVATVVPALSALKIAPMNVLRQE